MKMKYHSIMKEKELKKIEINGINSIGNYAFYWCNSIHEIKLHETVISIGSYAFSHCEKLESIIIY
jgi:hypothetical protein